MYSVFLALALSIDAFGVGISFGIRKIKIPVGAMIIISLVGLVILTATTALGNVIFMFLPGFISNFFSGIILVVMGIWIIKQGLSEVKKHNCQKEYSFFIKYLGITVNIVRTPEYGDLNCSNIIEPVEAIFLGIALSMDSAAACIGYENTFLLPVFILLFQLLFIVWGSVLGGKVFADTNTRACTLLSGTLIIVIGIIQFFC